MIDPREAKLPLWAQNLLEEHRTAAALAWPGRPDPAPLTEAGMKARVGLTVFEFTAPSASHPAVIMSFVDRYGILRRDGAGHGIGTHARSGPYYASETDAWLAAQWAMCRHAAQQLRRLQIRADAPSARMGGETDD
jgi:hypothetical protein